MTPHIYLISDLSGCRLRGPFINRVPDSTSKCFNTKHTIVTDIRLVDIQTVILFMGTGYVKCIAFRLRVRSISFLRKTEKCPEIRKG